MTDGMVPPEKLVRCRCGSTEEVYWMKEGTIFCSNCDAPIAVKKGDYIKITGRGQSIVDPTSDSDNDVRNKGERWENKGDY
jgi:hypothetical protein